MNDLEYKSNSDQAPIPVTTSIKTPLTVIFLKYSLSLIVIFSFIYAISSIFRITITNYDGKIYLNIITLSPHHIFHSPKSALFLGIPVFLDAVGLLFIFKILRIRSKDSSIHNPDKK